MTYKLDHAKFQRTSREEILKNFTNKLRQRVKMLQKKGTSFSEEEMIEAFKADYRGQFAQVYATKGISLNDLIEAGKEVLREETGEITIDSQTFIRLTPKIGRNDECPCGSGLKYKKCCGRESWKY